MKVIDSNNIIRQNYNSRIYSKRKKKENQILNIKRHIHTCKFICLQANTKNTNTYIYIFIFIYIKMDIKMRKPSILDKQLIVHLKLPAISCIGRPHHLFHLVAVPFIIIYFTYFFSCSSVVSICNAGGLV